jgi:hypothetical protein
MPSRREAVAALVAAAVLSASAPSFAWSQQPGAGTDTTRGGARANHPASAKTEGLSPEWRAVARALGREGELNSKEGVYTTSFPRSDLSLSVGGELVPTALGFGSWVAFRRGPGGASAMSDMVLLPGEVDAAVSALQANGIEVTALHRHFRDEQPQVMYLHSHATGDAAKIAAGYRAALEKTRTPLGPPVAPDPAGPQLDTAAVHRIVGHEGKPGGGVYKITVGRDDLGVTVAGAPVTSAMGLNSWAAFVGTDERAHVAGDIAMLEREVNPVVRALRANDIEIVSIHNHMLGDQPRVYFLHYWGTGTAETLARAFRAALDELGKR